MGRSLVHRSPTDCSVTEYDCESSVISRPWPARDFRAMGKNMYVNILIHEMKLKISYLYIVATTKVAKYRNGKITTTTGGQIVW
jgi:hypothetical protein